MPRAAIIGAGPAGLVSALAMQKAGWEAQVFEAYEESAGLTQGVFLTLAVNGMDAHFRSFAQHVIPVAQKAGTGILAMKTFGDGYILRSGTIDPIEALHYGLSQPVSVVITGIDKPEMLTQAMKAVSTFKPFTAEQTATFLGKTRDAAHTGKFEPFKTSSIFDGTANNPKWLGGSSGTDVKPSSPATEEKRVG